MRLSLNLPLLLPRLFPRRLPRLFPRPVAFQLHQVVVDALVLVPRLFPRPVAFQLHQLVVDALVLLLFLHSVPCLVLPFLPRPVAVQLVVDALVQASRICTHF